MYCPDYRKSCAGVKEQPCPDRPEIFDYCSVRIEGIARPYAYLTGGLPVKVGDMVEVPFGRYDALRHGQVLSAESCTRMTAPWPPEQTKTVLRIIPGTQDMNSTGTAEISAAPRTEIKRAGIPTSPCASAEPLKSRNDPPKKQKKPFNFTNIISAVLVIGVIGGVSLTAIHRNRQRAQAYEAYKQERMEYRYTEEYRLAQIKAEAEKYAADRAAAQRRKDEELNELYGGKVPEDGMPVKYLKYTSMGEPNRTEPCMSYYSVDPDQRYMTLYWYNSQRQTIASCRSHRPEDETEDVIYGFISYDPPLGEPIKKPSPPVITSVIPSEKYDRTPSDSGGRRWNLRDYYDDPDDLFEANDDYYEDEDEAWDDWYDG